MRRDSWFIVEDDPYFRGSVNYEQPRVPTWFKGLVLFVACYIMSLAFLLTLKSELGNHYGRGRPSPRPEVQAGQDSPR